MVVVADILEFLLIRLFTCNSCQTMHRAYRGALSILHLFRTYLQHTAQRRTSRFHVPNLLLPAALPQRHTIIIIHPRLPNYARVRTMHGRLVSALTHSSTLPICHRQGMRPVPLTLPLTSSPVLALITMMLRRGAVGSPPVSTRTLYLGFEGVRHLTYASLTPRPLI